MSKLNPCPICGSEAESNISFGAAQINCKNHDCIMIGCIMMNEPFADEIEKKWNESYSNQELAKLKEENEKLRCRLHEIEKVSLTIFKGLEKGISTVPTSFPHGNLKHYFMRYKEALGE